MKHHYLGCEYTVCVLLHAIVHCSFPVFFEQLLKCFMPAALLAIHMQWTGGALGSVCMRCCVGRYDTVSLQYDI